jgi:lathosterol oxidase
VIVQWATPRSIPRSTPRRLGQRLAGAPAWIATACALGFFAAIYALLCGGNWLLTRTLLPALRIGRPIDPRPLRAGQLREEIA